MWKHLVVCRAHWVSNGQAKARVHGSVWWLTNHWNRSSHNKIGFQLKEECIEYHLFNVSLHLFHLISHGNCLLCNSLHVYTSRLQCKLMSGRKHYLHFYDTRLFYICIVRNRVIKRRVHIVVEMVLRSCTNINLS